ncbi:MAG: nucleoside deaminase [Sedimentisphaeraceae bacterium JB056]
MTDPEMKVVLPFWADSFLTEYQSHRFVSDREKIMLAIELSRLNIQYGTGGPFGAAIFSHNGGKLLSIGINLVTNVNCSVAHAEMVAIITAQNTINNFDLSRLEGGCEMATSTEPCCMCMGGVMWSGISRILCGATDADAREAGFDEGPKPKNWKDEYINRGIKVETELCRERAREVLMDYKNNGGKIYNPDRS